MQTLIFKIDSSLTSSVLSVELIFGNGTKSKKQPFHSIFTLSISSILYISSTIKSSPSHTNSCRRIKCSTQLLILTHYTRNTAVTTHPKNSPQPPHPMPSDKQSPTHCPTTSTSSFSLHPTALPRYHPLVSHYHRA